MADKRLLLLSNSTSPDGRFLEPYADEFKGFLGTGVRRVLFVPFAGVIRSFEDYTALVRARFEAMGYELESVHETADPNRAVESAEAIAVGGGNTFQLLRGLYESGLIESIRARVEKGLPYVGWSAGSNVACPTIKTTNDMPIVEPPGLKALGLIPFQINPHYTDEHPSGHQGETRAQRIQEFLKVNPGTYVVGLREGSGLRVEGSALTLLGDKPARVFLEGAQATEHEPGDSLQFLLG
ncbi:MAG TPA: dipeptidase PepE [Pyrinomonadaceae bacterium]|jgi:dipeptidase E